MFKKHMSENMSSNLIKNRFDMEIKKELLKQYKEEELFPLSQKFIGTALRLQQNILSCPEFKDYFTQNEWKEIEFFDNGDNLDNAKFKGRFEKMFFNLIEKTYIYAWRKIVNIKYLEKRIINDIISQYRDTPFLKKIHEFILNPNETINMNYQELSIYVETKLKINPDVILNLSYFNFVITI